MHVEEVIVYVLPTGCKGGCVFPQSVIPLPSSMSVGLPCQPFGVSIQCTCDNRGQPVRCLPVSELANSFKGGGDNKGNTWDIMDWEDQEKKDHFYLDQSTEVILAFTLLVIIILSFIL